MVLVELSEVQANTEVAGYCGSNLARLTAMGLVWRCPDQANGYVRPPMPAGSKVNILSGVVAQAQPGFKYCPRLGNSVDEMTGPNPIYDSGELLFVFPAITRGNAGCHSHLEKRASVIAPRFEARFIDFGEPLNVGEIVLGQQIGPSRFYDKNLKRGIEDLGSLKLNRFSTPGYTPTTKLPTLSLTLG